MYDLTEIKPNLPTQYQAMLESVSGFFPAIAKATRNFNKSQSQFMNNMLTLSQPTELRSLRQILAEVNKSKMALDEAYFNIRKKQVQIKQKKRFRASDDLEREMLDIEIAELENQISNTMGYVEGAIRKISAYMAQYQSILKALGKEEITEEDFEKDEERYHIMKAFEQGLCAARSHGGIIDEGNHIYFYQIGISGTAAQVEVSALLSQEGQMVVDGKMPGHEIVWKWLHDLADKYAGCAKTFMETKHMQLTDENSLHVGG
jgi:hypothetical protein